MVDLVAGSVTTSEFCVELAKHPDAWTKNTQRQKKLKSQRDTQSVLLRSSKRSERQDTALGDILESEITDQAYLFPNCYRMALRLARVFDQKLGRVMLVRIKPHGRVYPHRPKGTYYNHHFRLHFCIDAGIPATLRHGRDARQLAAGEILSCDYAQTYELVNNSDGWMVYLVVDLRNDYSKIHLSPQQVSELLALGPLDFQLARLRRRFVRPKAPDQAHSGSGLNNFKRIRKNVDLSVLQSELHENGAMFLENASRQKMMAHHSRTQSVILRRAKPPEAGQNRADQQQVEEMPAAARFPATMKFARDFASSMQAELSRMLIVNLPAGASVSRHIDVGDYYDRRDRYHLVLQSNGGSALRSGNERVNFQQGELWWFQNKVVHEAHNRSAHDRVHLIFDLLPTHANDPIDNLGSIVRQIYRGNFQKKQVDNLPSRLVENAGPCYVALRSKGVLVGEAWSAAETHLAALQQGISTSKNKVERNKRANVDAIEIFLSVRSETVEFDHIVEERKWFSNVYRGVVGLEIWDRESGKAVGRVSPTTVCATNRSLKNSLVKQLEGIGLTLDQVGEEQLEIRILRGMQLIVPVSQNKPAAFLARGSRVVGIEEVTQGSVGELESLLSQYLLNSVEQSGRMKYLYYPSSGKEPEQRNNMIRQWMASLALCRIARYRDDKDALVKAGQNIEFNLSNFYRTEKGWGLIDDQGKVKLGAVALAALTISEHPQRASWSEQHESLLRTVELLWRRNGGFRTFYTPVHRNDNQNFYPGEALLLLASVYRETESDTLRTKFMKSMRYYRKWHLKHRNPAFVPWHTQAYFWMWEMTQDPELASWILEMNDWLLPIQQWLDAPSLEMRGRFYDPIRPFGIPHASSTGVYLEGLIDAYSLAKTLGDSSRANKYRTAVLRGLRSVMQLTYKDDCDMYYISKRDNVRGGVKTDVYNNAIRVDNVQHNLLAVLKINRRFEASDFEGIA
jgi:hypothetical protein